MILIQVSGLKAVETHLFHHVAHILGNKDLNVSYIL
jgi:hypothetical protein